MNWTWLEGAALEYLLVAPEALKSPSQTTSWEQVVARAAKQWQFSESDVVEYFRWFDRLGGLGAGEKSFAWQLLRRTSSRLLRYSGQACMLREDTKDPGIERLIWRWISLSVPPLSLRVACATGVPPVASEIGVLSRMMAPTGVAAVLHVHYGQLLDFEDLWEGLVKRFYRSGVLACDGNTAAQRLPIRFDLPPTGFGHTQLSNPPGILWERILLATLVARRTLEFVADGRVPTAPLETVTQQFGNGFGLSYSAFDWGTHHTQGPQLRLIGQGQIQIKSEAELQSSLFQRLCKGKGADSKWYSVFDHYLRTRAILYAHLVHRPWERGLAAFERRAHSTDAYEKVAGIQRHTNIETRASVLRIAAVETRCKAATWIRQEPNRYFPSIPKLFAPRFNTMTNRNCESAWLVAFDRAPAKDRAPKQAGRYTFSPAHYHAWREAQESADRVRRLIRTYPLTLRSTRGLDIMGLEKEGPLWVILPTLIRLREESCRIANRDGRKGVVPLRLTVHAGEDFDHQLTGLRHVSEPLLWGALERGDRIGHATPLGLEPEKWKDRHPAVMMTWWDRLIDIGWAVDCMYKFDLNYSNVLVWLAEDARKCVKHIWGERFVSSIGDPLDAARALWKTLGRQNMLLELDYPRGRLPDTMPAARMLYSYLFNASDRDRARKSTCAVDTGRDLPITTAIQSELQRLLGRLQVVIEIQPSSNLFIGGVDGLLDQRFFQLRAPTDEAGPDVLPLAISSDDPLAFATTTEDEYAYAWAGMVVEGRAPSLATRWLEDAADTSMRGRFTDLRSPQWAAEAHGERKLRVFRNHAESD